MQSRPDRFNPPKQYDCDGGFFVSTLFNLLRSLEGYGGLKPHKASQLILRDFFFALAKHSPAKIYPELVIHLYEN